MAVSIFIIPAFIFFNTTHTLCCATYTLWASYENPLPWGLLQTIFFLCLMVYSLRIRFLKYRPSGIDKIWSAKIPRRGEGSLLMTHGLLQVLVSHFLLPIGVSKPFDSRVVICIEQFSCSNFWLTIASYAAAYLTLVQIWAWTLHNVICFPKIFS